MTDASQSEATHSHAFDDVNPLAERRTRQVVWLTAVMMVAEIAAGWLFNSMALLADGWHMSSHALALGLSAGAYSLARRLRHDPRFAFGTGKVEVLGGYTSSVLLLGVAVYMVVESLIRLWQPVAIRFDEAIAVAVVGLAVNVYSAWLLSRGGGAHAHGAAHAHAGHAHHDLNLRSAFLHVVADAVTSVLAIVALIGGKYLGASWLDAAMGIVGAALVATWAVGLLRSSARVLLDAEMDAPVVAEIREAIRTAPKSADVGDLHVWRVGKGKYAVLLSVDTRADVTPHEVRSWLSVHEELVHVTVEVNRTTSPD